MLSLYAKNKSISQADNRNESESEQAKTLTGAEDGVEDEAEDWNVFAVWSYT